MEKVIFLKSSRSLIIIFLLIGKRLGQEDRNALTASSFPNLATRNGLKTISREERCERV